MPHSFLLSDALTERSLTKQLELRRSLLKYVFTDLFTANSRKYKTAKQYANFLACNFRDNG